MSVFYLKTLKHQRDDAVSFIEQFTTLIDYIDDETLSFELEGDLRVQLYLNFESFQADLGRIMTIVEGFSREDLMLEALHIAQTYRSGKVMDLADCVWLAMVLDEQSFLSKLKQFMNTIPSELMKTADMYILTQGNAVLAAQELYLHRNTFNYRLQKFFDFTKLDLRDRNQELFYKLARRHLD